LPRRTEPVEDECGHQNYRGADCGAPHGVGEVVDAQSHERDRDGCQDRGEREEQALCRGHPRAHRVGEQDREGSRQREHAGCGSAGKAQIALAWPGKG
jgi:hypothetical protein